MSKPPAPEPDQTPAPLDPIAEAMARARLRQRRARPVRRPPTNLGHDLRKLMRKHDKSKASSIRKLKQDWERLVGEEIARFCRPEKLTGNKTDRTLTLRVLPAAATRIQHEAEAIRQRISVAAGGTVTKLKFIQGSLGPAKTRKPKTSRPLSPAERKALEEGTQGIENARLRAALIALGAAVISDKA